jgi:hypothetical protein
MVLLLPGIVDDIDDTKADYRLELFHLGRPSISLGHSINASNSNIPTPEHSNCIFLPAIMSFHLPGPPDQPGALEE